MTKKEDIIIMNFSGIYRQQQFWRTGEIQRQNISWVEVQELTGSNCYCDEEAAKVLKEKLKKFSAEGMHFIDSGNYHYMSRIWLEKLEIPFRLVVFDNHTDMQLPAFGGLLSCGGWIAASLEELPLLEEVILIGPDQEAFDQTEPVFRQKVQYLSREKLRIMTPAELSTVRISYYEEGVKAAEMLQQLRDGSTEVAMKEYVPHKIIRRSTTKSLN